LFEGRSTDAKKLFEEALDSCPNNFWARYYVNNIKSF